MKKVSGTDASGDDTKRPEKIPVLFKWNVYHPDQREYRNQSIEVAPLEIYIKMDIPLDYYKLEPESQAVILTLDGLKYVIDQFDTVFLPKKSETKVEDENWETDVSGNGSSASKDENWDAEFDDDKKGSDQKDWNEKEEEWE